MSSCCPSAAAQLLMSAHLRLIPADETFQPKQTFRCIDGAVQPALQRQHLHYLTPPPSPPSSDVHLLKEGVEKLREGEEAEGVALPSPSTSSNAKRS
eukprot:620182-Hanusia_phi.AAC.5